MARTGCNYFDVEDHTQASPLRRQVNMKRKRPAQDFRTPNKRTRYHQTPDTHPTQPLLDQYYPRVSTLRQFLASRLTKKRRKKLVQFGRNADLVDENVKKVLDNTLVGTFDDLRPVDLGAIDRELTLFTQQLSESTFTINATQGLSRQSEIVDFVIWRLFRKHAGSYKPPHILCHGYQRLPNSAQGDVLEPVPGVPGIFASCGNFHVQTLKEQPWSALPGLLGSGAERIISDMLIDCGVFVQVGGSTNLNQLSGKPVSELKTLRMKQDTAYQDPVSEHHCSKSQDTSSGRGKNRGLSDIRFVRHRMLYARPSLSAKGRVRFGLGYVHALNRSTASENVEATVHLMKYIFPKQFGLHNVFSSDTDHKDTSQAFKDYTLREKEIARTNHEWKQKRKTTISHAEAPRNRPPVPRRLLGPVIALFQRVRKRHAKCHYHALLQHYCPALETIGNITDSSTQYASSAANVSAFCRSALSIVFPNEVWGHGEGGIGNRRAIFRYVDKFVHLRRYESMSMHEVMQSIKLRSVQWLIPPQANAGHSLSSTDFDKRKELMAELLYYVFDSFLIPLLRGCFHITESNVHRNQLFYFRHDVWQAMTAPSLTSLKDTMMEECSNADVRKMLSKRALGISHVRLLPKEKGMRPIINLRRRGQKLQHGELVLGKSINSILTPAFSVLNYEKAAHPEMLASALFSVDDIFPRLQAFRNSLLRQGHGDAPLYFGKVDVQACFDTVPQERLMDLAKVILTADQYNVARYARAKLIGRHNEETPGFGAKPSWKFLTKASRKAEPFQFAQEVAAEGADGRTRSLFVDGVVQKSESRRGILDLLEEHIQANLIKIGKHFYRQKKGIPQGSIVSSLLCSYLYGELEREVLGFLHDGQSLLLRLIDDFLVISTRREVVERFMQTMHHGLPQFGVQVKAEKSRANFDLTIDNKAIARLPEVTNFPYCGNAINTRTLDLSKDMDRRRLSKIADSVTVEYSHLPGQTFYRKTLNALKLQMHAMLLSTSYNSLETVLSNLHHSFTEVAQKSYHYIRCLPTAKQPSDELVIRTVNDTIKLACVLMKRGKRMSAAGQPHECAVSSIQARCEKAIKKLREARYFWLDLVPDGESADSSSTLSIGGYPCSSTSAPGPDSALARLQETGNETMTALLAPARLPLSDNNNLHDTEEDDGGGIAFLTFDNVQSLICGETVGGNRSKQSPHQRVFCVSLPDIASVSRGVGGYRSLTEPALELEARTAAMALPAAVVDENMMGEHDHETAPSSPPELTYSKSSKSSNSSFRSSSLSEHGSTEKLSHFEDVTLQDDDGRSSVEDCNVKPESRPTLRRPKRRSSPPSDIDTSKTISPPAMNRDIRYPSLKGAVTGVLRDQSLNLPHGRGLRRGYTSPSSPTFMTQGPQKIASRSPSPSRLLPGSNGVPRSPQTVGSLTPRTSWSAPSRNSIGALSRRQSWQPGRKTVKELEAEYNDEDEEVPEEAILENVPITPVPGQPQSKPPSPHRRPSQQASFPLPSHANLHSAKVPKHAKRPSAPTIMPNGQYGAPRSPRHPRPQMMPHSATVAAFPSDAFSQKHRTKSWNADLNEEARQLSAALEEHAERLSSEKRRSATNSVSGSPPRPRLEQKDRAKTTILELPPVQKQNIMIDPLPISKEKEAVLTRTRPSWLPPKSKKEEKKHIKEWEQMMKRAAEAEKKCALQLQEQKETKEEQDASISRLWEDHVLPNWNVAVKEPRTRELWWRGVTPKARGQVWQKAIGNELGLLPTSFEAALRRADEVEEKVAEMPTEELNSSKEAAWFSAIERDVPNVYPELRAFEHGTDLYHHLTRVLKAYAMYRSDVGYVYGVHLVAGMLCFHMSAAEAFVSLANLLNRPLPLAFLVHDQTAMARQYEMVLGTLKYKFTKLHSHLTCAATGLKPDEYLDPLFRCLFAYNLPPEHVSRIWDIYVFEGDKALVRAAVAVLGRLEGKLYGSRDEILDLVSWRNEKQWAVGSEDAFIQAVRDAGKVDDKGEVLRA